MPCLIKSQRQPEKGKWVFLVRGTFSFLPPKGFSPALLLQAAACPRAGGARLTPLGWSSQMQPGSFGPHRSSPMPHQNCHAKWLAMPGKRSQKAHGQAAGPRLMEASFLPPLLPARGPSLPFAEPQFLFMGKWDNENDPKPWRHWGCGLGRAPHNAACASPWGSCWCSKARQDMAEPPWPCHGARALQQSRSILFTGRDALLACVRDLCWGRVLWHHRSVPTYALIVSPTYQSPHASHRQGQEISGVRVSYLQHFTPPPKPPP